MEKVEYINPEKSWWLQIYIVNDVMQLTNICFKSVEEKNTFLSEQNQHFTDFTCKVKGRVGIKIINYNIELVAEAPEEGKVTIHSEKKSTTKYQSIESFSETIGSYSLSMFDS